MSEMRKVGVALTLAHQNLLIPEVRHAVLGNAGNLLAFRTGVEDATLMARELTPAFEPIDLINLPNRSFCARLMIDCAPSEPFSRTLVPRE